MNFPLLSSLFLIIASISACADGPAAPAPAAPLKLTFDDGKPGEEPADPAQVVQGAFIIADDAGNKVLQQQAEPLDDGAVLFGKSMKAGGTISARIKAGKSRRSFPRFGVSLHGISGAKVRVVPARKAIELVLGEETILATVDFPDWKEDAWSTVEITVSEKDAAWSAEARVWADGQPRPESPTLSAKLPAAPTGGKAGILGTPYAGKTILFDDVTITAKD